MTLDNYECDGQLNLFGVDFQSSSVNLQERTGHWIKSNIPNEEYVCSECGGASWYYDYQANAAKSRYCPNCGCRMVEPQESEEQE